MPKKNSNGAITENPISEEGIRDTLLGLDDSLLPVIDALPDEVVVINPDFTVAWVNGRVRERHAWGVWDTQGVMCYQISHDRDEPCNGLEHPCPLRHVLRSKKQVFVKHIHRGPNGSDRHVEISASPILNETGEVDRVVEIIRDVDRRQKAFDEQTHDQQIFARAFEHNPCLMTLSEKESGRFFEVNDTFLETLGYRRDEVIGKTGADLELFVDDNQRSKIKKSFRERGSIRDFDVDVRTKNGEIRRGLLSADLVDLGNERVFLTVMNDITERKRAEEALRESEELWRSLTDNSPDHILTLDSNLRTEFINFCAPGVSKNDLIGIPIYNYIDDEKKRGEVRALLRQTLSTGEPVRYETVYNSPEGKLEYESRAVPRYDGAKIVGLTIHARDITLLKLAEQERLRFVSQSQKAHRLESLGNLAGGIAHDFNNLLMGVLGNVDLSLLELPPESPVRERIYDIETAAKRAADLAKQMLAFSGKGRFVVRPLNLRSLLQETAHLLQPSIPKTTQLSFEFGSELSPINGDIGQIRQIATNLIINAREAIGEGPGMIAIRAGTLICERTYFDDFWNHSELPEGLYSYIEISDDGCGILHEIRTKIFDPFFSTKFIGRGLGLAEVLGIVRGHGGAIRFESEPGRGATFRVFLPAVDVPADQSESVSAPDETSFNGRTVLLVDDEALIRSVGRAMLEHLGFTVVSARDGDEAMRLFRADPQIISCVLLDLTMPNKDGAQCCREMVEVRGDIPVVLTSGYHEQDLRVRFANEGFAGFIQKPYQSTTLKKTLLEVLERANGSD